MLQIAYCCTKLMPQENVLYSSCGFKDLPTLSWRPPPMVGEGQLKTKRGQATAEILLKGQHNVLTGLGYVQRK